MNKNLDVQKVFFDIRKATPKRYDRMCIYKQKDGRYKITLTSHDAEELINYGLITIMAGLNHEFIHALLGELVGYKAFNGYDECLGISGEYDSESIQKTWR